VVEPEVADAVNAAVASLEAQMPPGAARSLAIAQTYFDRGFNVDGIQTLEAAIAAGEATPAIYRTLATVYWERLVLTDAQAAYAGLLDVAAPNSEDRAIALWGLGRSAAVLGDRAAAQRYLEQARDLYQALGDRATASKIAVQLQELGQ
jgi:tetratricopeptide (TPR) repeat protein